MIFETEQLDQPHVLSISPSNGSCAYPEVLLCERMRIRMGGLIKKLHFQSDV